MPKKKFENWLKCLRDKTPQLAVLIDPDKFNEELIILADKSQVSCFLIGGSQLKKGNVSQTMEKIQKRSSLPTVLFPGDETQLSDKADGLLLISLLSGRNPEYLIGKHVKAARQIKKMKLGLLSTAYLLIGSNGNSKTQKVSKTTPLHPQNAELILDTAMAAEQLGFGAIYLEAGSGSKEPVLPELIRAVKKTVNLPVIVGGGIDSATKVKRAIKAGANLVVVGNALEKNVHLLNEISLCFKAKRKTLKKTKT